MNRTGTVEDGRESNRVAYAGERRRCAYCLRWNELVRKGSLSGVSASGAPRVDYEPRLTTSRIAGTRPLLISCLLTYASAPLRAATESYPP